MTISPENRASTGISGLDAILHGGLIKQASYLVRGGPGQGKTTVGLHFLSAGEDNDDRSLFIGFQETEKQIKRNAESIGIDVAHVEFLSFTPDESFFTEQLGYDVFSSADMEHEPVASSLLKTVAEKKPSKVFIDSLTQLRFLSSDIYQYRKSVLSLISFLKEREITVMFSSESSQYLPDDDLQFIADGVIWLGSGAMGSSVIVEKFRGSSFDKGFHQMRIGESGITVFPKPKPPVISHEEVDRKQWSSGVPALDDILYGGVEAGTVTLITGPSGVGKSTLASSFATKAGLSESRSAVFLFEEEISAYLYRAEALKVGIEEAVSSERTSIEQVEPMRYLADEFSEIVMRKVRDEGVRLIVMDSIAGFELTLEGDSLKARLHSLVKSICRMGASVILVNETHSTGGELLISEKGISYLSDNVIYLRYMEINGKMKKTLGVLKKRLSPYKNDCYLYEIGPNIMTVKEKIADAADLTNLTGLTDTK